jgi:hypothetical protein
VKRKITRGTAAAIVGVLLFLAFGASSCSGSSGSKSTKATSAAIRNTQNEGVEAFNNQRAAVPYPEAQLRSSVERQNLARRLLEFNKKDKIGYVYILSFGKFIGYYVIKGKVSSNSSQMTNQTWITKWTCPGGCSDSVGPVDAAGDDGSFGPSEPGIFFFTAAGALIQTDSNYIYSDQPFSINADLPQLVK